MAKASEVHSYIPGSAIHAITMTAADVADATLSELRSIGIDIAPSIVREMMNLTSGMDAAPDLAGTMYPGTIGTPLQFLQAWLPGFVNVVTQARKIDEILGITTAGSWEDEEIIQGVLEPTGLAVPYTDYGNIPLASWNPGYDRRSVVRFEQGLRVGKLEELRTAKARINTAAQKRSSAALSLDISRNRIGFYGYNGGANRTYGFFNDPALPAYKTAPAGTGGTTWATKTFLEITADIRTLLNYLVAQSGDTIDPQTSAITLVLPSNSSIYLTITSEFGNSVMEWVNKTYKKLRIVTAPELNGANGGANVAYAFADRVVNDGSTDGGATFVQIVPTKFMTIGVEKNAKSYVEDYGNATAGVLLKRPFAVVRMSGI